MPALATGGRLCLDFAFAPEMVPGKDLTQCFSHYLSPAVGGPFTGQQACLRLHPSEGVIPVPPGAADIEAFQEGRWQCAVSCAL